MRIPGSDVSLILVHVYKAHAWWDCDLKAKPFGRGCGTERLVFTVSIMLLVPRRAKRPREGGVIKMQQGLAGASECLRRAWRMAQRPIIGPEAALHEVSSVALRFFLSIAGTKRVPRGREQSIPVQGNPDRRSLPAVHPVDRCARCDQSRLWFADRPEAWSV